MSNPEKLRIGIDLGGTKIAGILMAPDDSIIAEARRPTPRQDYGATIAAIAALADQLAGVDLQRTTVGLGMPGSIVPGGETVQNANSTWLNARRLSEDLASRLGQPVRCANDANCFALSEAHDGAGQGAASVFGVILGTGCGGGLVSNGRLINGPRNIGGEWGHNPLPWPEPDEYPGPECWCGRRGCLETWLSGPGMSRDHLGRTGHHALGEEIVRLADTGDTPARETLSRHLSRLARGLAHVINIFDPEVIVLGGGLSGMQHLYDQLPERVAPHIFSDLKTVNVRPPRWGDASGVRGAARLWIAGH